jgi:hypothetical protein
MTHDTETLSSIICFYLQENGPGCERVPMGPFAGGAKRIEPVSNGLSRKERLGFNHSALHCFDQKYPAIVGAALNQNLSFAAAFWR